MPEIDALSTGKKVGNILNETLKVGGGATTATTPTVTIPRDTATTATVEPLLRLQRTSSGAPAIGIGGSLEFEVETAAANNEIGAAIQAVTTNVTNLTEAFDLVFLLMAGGAAATEFMRLTSTKTLVLPALTTGARATPNIMNGAANTGTIFYASTGWNFSITTNPSDFYIGQSGVRINAGGSGYCFTGTADTASAAADSGVNRAANKIIEIHNGTAGSYTGTALRLGTQTIAQLTSAATAGSGARATVSDALAPTFQATVTAGGAVVTPVYSDGTNWKVG